MKRRSLLLAPLALLGISEARTGVHEWAARHVARKGGLVSLGSYQFKLGEAERFAAVLAANEKRIAEHNSRISTITLRRNGDIELNGKLRSGDEWPIPIPPDLPPGPSVSFDL